MAFQFLASGANRYAVQLGTRLDAPRIGEVVMQEVVRAKVKRRHWNAYTTAGEMVAYGLQTRGAAASYLEMRHKRHAAIPDKE